MRDVATNRRLAHPDVDHVGVGRRDGNGTHRGALEKAIGDILPEHAAIGRLPDTAAGRPKIEDLLMYRIARYRYDTPPTIGTDRAPLKRGEEGRSALSGDLLIAQIIVRLLLRTHVRYPF